MKPQLPLPSPGVQASSAHLTKLIKNEIEQHRNWIPFSRLMELALYTSQCGYYSGGSYKISTDGDFITAPTLSPLSGQTLARQLTELLLQTADNIHEFGIDTGYLAATLLQNLSDGLSHYYIIELSAELAERQRQHILEYTSPEAAAKVIHLTVLPEHFDGVIIGNEVSDTMPVERLIYQGEGFQQTGISLENDKLIEAVRPLAQTELIQTASLYFLPLPSYTSELHSAQYAFIQTLAVKLQRGSMIFIDYGFDAAQYYHPQCKESTFIGRYRHHTTHDPFFSIGLTDLAAHVNFTDIARAGTESGLGLIGYLPQSYFLLNLDITDLPAQIGSLDSIEYIQVAAAVQRLIHQHETGELFEVIASGKGIDIDWTGFVHGDTCHKL